MFYLPLEQSILIMKTFVATLGWTEWPVASAIIKHGLSRGDKVVLLSPEKKDDRSRTAINEVKSFVSRFAPYVEVSEISIPVHSPVDAISSIARLVVRESRGKDLIVNLSGGMRILVLETLLALMLTRVENLVLELQTEDKVDLQLPLLWRPAKDLSPEARSILKVLKERGSISLSNLARALRISLTTAYRLSKHLENIGVITSRKIGKERMMELTTMGKIILATLIEEGT